MTRRPQALKLPYRPPQAERRHFVFLNRCGCPFGLVEASARRAGGPPRLADEDAAWDDFCDTRVEERRLRERGVTVVHVTHDEYEARYYPMMLPSYQCPHGGGS